MRGAEALLLEITDRTDSLMRTHRLPLPFSPHRDIVRLRRVRGETRGELEILGRYLDWQINPFLPELPAILERTVELAAQFPEDAFARAVGKKARRVNALREVELICDMAATPSWDAEREWPQRIKDLAQATDEDGAGADGAGGDGAGGDAWWASCRGSVPAVCHRPALAAPESSRGDAIGHPHNLGGHHS